MLLRTCLTIVICISVYSSSYGFCFETASTEYGVPAELLAVISRHESGNNPEMVHWNTNGTYDYGLMGINTCHEPILKKLGIPWQTLADPCTNVRVGAWLLRKCIDKYGYNWKGIGCYNSQTPEKRDRYARIISNLLHHKYQNPRTKPNPETIITEIQTANPPSPGNTLLAEVSKPDVDLLLTNPAAWSR